MSEDDYATIYQKADSQHSGMRQDGQASRSESEIRMEAKLDKIIKLLEKLTEEEKSGAL